MLDSIRIRSATLVAGGSVVLLAHLSACSSSDESKGSPEAGTGGSANTGGSSTGGKGTGGTSSSGGTSAIGGTSDGGPDSSTGGADAGTGGSTSTGGADAGTGGSTATGPDGGCPSLGALTPPTVDSSIAVPGTTTLKMRFYAVGYQIYTCTATTAADAAVTYGWKLKAPDANLYDDSCSTPKAIHFAGPTWKSTTDGSYVVGTKVGQYQPLLADGGADTADVLWLKLTGTDYPSPDGGMGMFSDISYIQRLNTTGGVVPASTICDGSNVNQTTSIPYTAVYYFYTG